MEEREKESAFADDLVSRTAASAFGIRYLYPLQRLVIANILDAAASPEESPAFSRQIVLLPTGAGKSFCFLIPSLLLDGPTLVIYPLLSLIADQKRKLDEAGIPAAVFTASQGKEQREEDLQKLEEGKIRVILTNPESLCHEKLVSRLASCQIVHVAVDEAHCVGDWGDSFRPAYLKLGKLIKGLAPRVVTAFTATASEPVLAQIKEVLFEGEASVIQGDLDRPNIRYSVVNSMNKKKEALRLAVSLARPLIIFCGTRYKAEDMAREIAALQGTDCVRFYHAGMEREEKRAVEDFFFSATDAVLCATCAYGMGVDKKDVRTVIHLESPLTAEEYMQESGRAGRDGKQSEAILLWSPDDSRKFASLPQGSRGHAMLAYAEASTCRRQLLLRVFGSEDRVCSGCDVCDRGGPAPFAGDGQRVLDFLRGHRRLYDRNSLSSELIGRFNKLDRPLFHINVWEHSDIACVLDALFAGGLIRECPFPWKGRITIAKAFKSC